MGVYKPGPVKGTIARIDDAGNAVDTVTFQYNPTTIRRTTGVGWTLQIPPGGYLPIPMFGAGEAEVITIDLFLDARESSNRESALNDMSKFESLLRANLDPNTPDFAREEFTAPPLLMLNLGAKRSWFVVARRIDITEEMFDVNLIPVRVRITLELAVIIDVAKQQQALKDLLSRAAASNKVQKTGGGDPYQDIYWLGWSDPDTMEPILDGSELTSSYDPYGTSQRD